MKKYILFTVLLCCMVFVVGCQDDVSIEPTTFDWSTATQTEKEVAFEQHHARLTPELRDVLDKAIGLGVIKADPLSYRLWINPETFQAKAIYSFESDVGYPISNVDTYSSRDNLDGGTSFDRLTATDSEKQEAYQRHYDSLEKDLQDVLDWTIENKYINVDDLSLRIRSGKKVINNETRETIDMHTITSFESDFGAPIEMIIEAMKEELS